MAAASADKPWPHIRASSKVKASHTPSLEMISRPPSLGNYSNYINSLLSKIIFVYKMLTSITSNNTMEKPATEDIGVNPMQLILGRGTFSTKELIPYRSAKII